MHPVPNRSMARTDQSPRLRPHHRPRRQRPHGPRTELKLIVPFSPENTFSHEVIEILLDLGLDGHWLMVQTTHYLPTLQRYGREYYYDAYHDLLYDDLIGMLEIVDEGSYRRREAYVEENIGTLVEGMGLASMKITALLEHYDHDHDEDLFTYVAGYTYLNPFSGILHLDFRT